MSGQRGIVPSCTNFLEFVPPGWEDEEHISEMKSGDRIVKIDIAFNPADFLDNYVPGYLSNLPPNLRQLLESPDAKPYWENDDTITPQMRIALEQILKCPFQGVTKHLYLEAKCLELVALKIEQLQSKEESVAQSNILKSDDINRIHWAREILLKNLAHPPSLLELAKEVGLNDYKLKLGFCQFRNNFYCSNLILAN
ncbi:MAG: hypothetical protein V7L29_10980 [Nostoc sp.]|uniref:hypothetical protein n=1 Tax=Nostoc sp. TaxID=1180 RepID=UPI002FF7CDF8